MDNMHISPRLRKLIERSREIEKAGGIGKQTVKFPKYRNDIIAKVKRRNRELLNKIS